MKNLNIFELRRVAQRQFALSVAVNEKFGTEFFLGFLDSVQTFDDKSGQFLESDVKFLLFFH